MSRLLDDDDLDDLPQRDRELTLSTGAILAIFLGLVLLCAVFFGFGYNLGRKSTGAPNAALPAATNDAEAAATPSSTFDNFKPSPGSPSTPAPNNSTAPPASTSNAATTTVPLASPTTAPVTTSKPAATAEAQPAPTPVRTAPAPAPTPARSAATTPPAPTRAPQPAAPTTTPGGAFVVQIAAITPTHKDDADLLANALHSKGYDVVERTETQDKLIHIQVGPFATKADAEAMRERLIVDGYNAIVK